MIYKSYLEGKQKFDSLEETGMGYQVILAKLMNESEKKFYIVYNSELIIDLDYDFDIFKQRAFAIKGIKLSLSEARPLYLDINSIKVFSKSFTEDLIKLYSKNSNSFFEYKKENKNRRSGGKGAIDSPIELASGEEVFTRLSAFENDRRIDFEKKRLKDGSFTTTYLDYRDCIRYDDNPVDRYALPNDEEIKYAFTIIPRKFDKLQRGIVQPLFGKEGGGLEAYFNNGTSDGTFKGKIKYGEIL